MKNSFILYAMASLLLMGCGQDFDEKYEDNLQKLTQEADEINAHIDQRFKESEATDKILNRDEIETKPETESD